jgi:4-amino-4-deoxy-L-arabinose transferase-like glycosyltransferase
LFVGLLVRVLSAVLFRGIIHTEGAEYARIAENLLSGVGYVGIATPGTQLFFPPLFPILIAAGSLITGDTESGGLLVSILAGTTLIWSTYLITCHLYDRRTAQIAAALVALHPLLIGYSVNVCGEIAYLSLAVPGIYFGLQAIRQRRTRLFAIAGCLFGLAYLIRPEAISYPFLVMGAALLHAFITDRTETWRMLSRSLVVGATFLPLALPYIVWLSVNTGQLRIEGKSPLNYATQQRRFLGMTSYEASFALDDQLVGHGIWLQPNLSIMTSTKAQPDTLFQYLRAKRGCPGPC